MKIRIGSPRRIVPQLWKDFNKPLLLWFLPLLAYLAGSLLLCRSCLHLGFNTDAFVLFDQARSGLPDTLKWDGSRHYMPITVLWTSFQYLFLGLHQQAYEIVNILQHGVIAYFVYLIAKELGLSRGSAFLSGVFFLSAASAFQVVLWSIVGNNYFVSCFFYMLALLLFLRKLHSGSGRPAWTPALFFALALFSHEQSVSLFPLCCVAVLLFDQRKRSKDSFLTAIFTRLRRMLQQTAALLIPLLVFLLTKYWMSLHRGGMLDGVSHYGTFVEGITQGLLRCVSFRSNGVFFNEINHLIGTFIGFPAWGCIFFLILSLAFLRLSPRGRFLLLWIVGHLFMMQIAVGIAARHVYLPTAAASILMVEIFSRYIFGKCGEAARPPMRLFPALLSLILMSTLLCYSIFDLHRAQGAWIRADRIIRGLEHKVASLSRGHQDVKKLVILNATAMLESPYSGIYTFKNGLRQLVNLGGPAKFESVILAHTPGHDNNANGSFLMPMSEVARLLTDRATAALNLDRAGEKFSRVHLSSLRKQGLLKVHNPWVEMATPATRPQLEWTRGRRQWKLSILPNQRLETLLTAPAPEKPWFIIRWKQLEDRQFEIRVGKTWDHHFSASNSAGWTYTLAKLPSLEEEPSRIPISIRNSGPRPLQTSIFGFLRPKRMVNAETAPEFLWNQHNVLEITTHSTFGLPLPTDSPNPRVQIISSSDENRRIELLSETSQKIELNYPTSTDGPWMTLTADLPLVTRSISISALGPQPARIRQVWFPRSEDLEQTMETRQ